jgi:basic amino acid/polyamine antiporter, APA family
MSQQDNSTNQVTLKRGLNLPLLLLYGVGNILGAGIYVLIGEVAHVAGYLAPVAFLTAAIIAGMTGVSYVELSSRYPLSAGEAIYVHEGFSLPSLSTIVGLLVCASGIISAATLSRGFVGYLQLFAAIPESVIIIFLVVSLGLIALIGIVESVSVAALFTLLETAGLLLVIWVSRDALGGLSIHLPAMIPTLDGVVWTAIFSAAFLSFFAFIGFEDMVNVAEEVKNPTRTLPLAILLALLICTLLYAAISVIAVLQVSPEQLGKSSAPLADVFVAATGQKPTFIGLLGLFAIINGILIQIIMVSRIIYGMAKKNWFPAVFAQVSKRFRTPTLATLLVVGIILLLALSVPLVSLAKITSFVVLIIFTLVNAALIQIKRHQPKADNATIVPMIFPILGCSMSLSLAVFNLAFI